jgi:hypothetical protein
MRSTSCREECSGRRRCGGEAGVVVHHIVIAGIVLLTRWFVQRWLCRTHVREQRLNPLLVGAFSYGLGFFALSGPTGGISDITLRWNVITSQAQVFRAWRQLGGRRC